MVKKFQKKSYGWSVLGFAVVIALSAVSLVNADETVSKENDLKINKSAERPKEPDNKESDKKEVTYKEGVDTQYTDRDKQKGMRYGYIVLNGFYYVKTGETIPKEQLGQQVAKVERIGDWEIKKTGDSNEVSPGPIYSIKNKVLYMKKGKLRQPISYLERKSLLQTS